MSSMSHRRIAQAEGHNWKEALNTYLEMYRTTPHSTTGVSPAELMFKRKIRTKLPSIQDKSVDDLETRDRDSEQKGKGK